MVIFGFLAMRFLARIFGKFGFWQFLDFGADFGAKCKLICKLIFKKDKLCKKS